MKKKWIPYLLVVLQLAAILAILFSAPKFCSNYYLLAVEVFGILLGLTAIFTMKFGNFNIAPTPKFEGELRTRGVFKFIRHPMYAAHILWAIAQLMLLHNWIAGYSFLIFSAPLYLLRIDKEEEMMIKQFGEEYKEYMKRTGKLIPRFIKINKS